MRFNRKTSALILLFLFSFFLWYAGIPISEASAMQEIDTPTPTNTPVEEVSETDETNQELLIESIYKCRVQYNYI